MLYRLSYVGQKKQYEGEERGYASFDAILVLRNSKTTSPLERVMGIEPTSSAWKAEVLPLNYTRIFRARFQDLIARSPA